MERRQEFKVVVYVRRLPDSYSAPKLIRKLLSALSEEQNATYGSSFDGMSFDKAESLAKELTIESYVDGEENLRSSRAVVVRVR